MYNVNALVWNSINISHTSSAPSPNLQPDLFTLDQKNIGFGCGFSPAFKQVQRLSILALSSYHVSSVLQ
jgi:hypothetical protein